MRKKELISEVLSDFRQYDESGLIDYYSLNRWIKNSLFIFGNNVMVKADTVLAVKNFQANLPEDFWALSAAYKCKPCGYEVDKEDESVIQSSRFYRERIESDKEWDNMSDSFKYKNCKEITETIYFKSKKAKLYYKNPTLLKLKKGFRKDKIHDKCLNLRNRFTGSAQDEIDILGEILNTNFKRGYIYMRYYALPTDEDGELLIPDTQNRYLEDYIITHCKRRILENLIVNNDDPNKVNILSYFRQQEADLFMLARKETKWETLPADWATIISNSHKREFAKYDIMLPNK